MRNRWGAALVAAAGIVAILGLLGAALPRLGSAPALAQSAPAPGAPSNPGGPGYGPGGPGNPGYGPGFGPGYRPGFGPGFGRRGRGFGPGAIVFAFQALLRFLLLIALLVIAWKVITLRSLWGRPDGAVQVIRERFARGEINEEEYRKRLAALS